VADVTEMPARAIRLDVGFMMFILPFRNQSLIVRNTISSDNASSNDEYDEYR